MKQFKSVILSTLLVFLIFSSWSNGQEIGGPYTTDENTVILMHFDGTLTNNSSLSSDGVPHGNDVSFSSHTLPNLGSSLRINNSNSSSKNYISIPHNNNLSLTESWTIEFWFKITSWDQSHNNWPLPILLPTTGFDSNYYLEIPASWGRLKYGFSSSDGGVQILSSENSITTGTWYHVALINDYENSAIELLLHDSDYNKLEEQIGSYNAGTTISTGTQDLRIGAGIFNENHFDGILMN